MVVAYPTGRSGNRRADHITELGHLDRLLPVQVSEIGSQNVTGSSSRPSDGTFQFFGYRVTYGAMASAIC
ncbi:hypothetical protein GCM10009835_45490 [Planosporangium flavigriseum]|uniref:Uncharacterized protein n=1 Tax=Planosporangium flavigriseum TaxID=373681 RepID=A0A8J3LYE8_9ACTN|nr:hypothetical protein Pfl04_40740 [Planosporangium flavigriseum]